MMGKGGGKLARATFGIKDNRKEREERKEERGRKSRETEKRKEKVKMGKQNY
jgi:hypothetical protein